MAYIAKKVCSFGGQDFLIGNPIPDELIHKGRVADLVKMGVISEVPEAPALEEVVAQVGQVKFALTVHAEEGELALEFTEDEEGLKATATLTNNNKADGWNVMLFTAIYNGDQLVSVEVTPDTIVKGTPKTISTPVDTSKYQEGYEIKAFLWEAGSLIPLSGVLPLEQ